MCIKETSQGDGDVSFMHTKHIFVRKKTGIGGYKYLYLPLYNLNIRYFGIKSLVPRISNLRDLTVYG